jgi:hypothetical protein
MIWKFLYRPTRSPDTNVYARVSYLLGQQRKNHQHWILAILVGLDEHDLSKRHWLGLKTMYMNKVFIIFFFSTRYGKNIAK